MRSLIFALALLTSPFCGPLAADEIVAPAPQRVAIEGYDDDAMEPFVTRDGRFLLFNNLNKEPTNTDIHFAERKDDLHWTYRGRVNGVNTPALEGCPTMDRAGKMYFVSPRDYAKTFCTIYTGSFKDGSVTDVRAVESISRKTAGIVNYDVDISPDGNTLTFVDSLFKKGSGPQWANLVTANWDGSQFVRSADSARLLDLVNKAGALQYAPAMAADLRTLYFTRFDRKSGFGGPQIYRSVRAAADAPFSAPAHLKGLGYFVEGPAFSADEHWLYFHRQDGELHKERYNLYAIPIP